MADPSEDDNYNFSPSNGPGNGINNRDTNEERNPLNETFDIDLNDDPATDLNNLFPNDSLTGNDDLDLLLPGVDDLPLFANNDAKKIHSDIQNKEIKIDQLINKINDLKERYKIMNEHYKNVQQEVQHTNSLLSSKKLETQTENHLKQLISRSYGKAKLDSKNLSNEITKVNETLSSLQNSIYQSNEKLDEYKLLMNWNQEDLDQWAIAAKQKEEDNLTLQKYTRIDEIKIKELSLTIEQLNSELLKKRTILENEVTDTQAKQMELDRIADEFRLLHKERQQLVNQWQETIEAMKIRDVEINSIGERYAIAKQERIKQENKVLLQKKRINAQVAENNEIESKTESLAKLVSRKREEMVTGMAKLTEYRNELESLKNELTSAAEGLVMKRNLIANKSHEIEEKRVNVERERRKYQEVKNLLEVSKNNVLDAEQLIKSVEEKLLKTEKSLLSNQNKLKLNKDLLLKEIQNLHDIKRNENLLRVEINGTLSSKKNLDSKLLQLDKESARQQELLYNAEFQIQQIERKIARGLGQRTDDEKKVLKQNIEELENTLNEMKEKKKILMNQVRKISNELTTIKLLKDKLLETENNLNEKINEIKLSNSMIENEITQKIKDKEEIIVANDIIRLEVRRLRGLLSLKADVVYSLENRKEQLILSLLERKDEINIHRDILKSTLKLLLDEKHTIVMDLKQRELNIEKLKSKFYIQSGEISGSGEGENGGAPVSQSYYIIKAAQKREELRRKGDELDTNITKKEREIRALQTTLDHLNARNVAYRTSFQKVDLQGEETEILRKLEERIKLLKEYLFKKKKELQRILTDSEEDMKRLDQIKIHKQRILQQREHLLSAQEIVHDEIGVQQQQLDEYNEKIKRLTDAHHEKVMSQLEIQKDMIEQQGGTLEEKAVYAEVLKDVVQNVLYTLGQLSNEFPEVTDTLTLRLQEADLKIPPKPAAKQTTNILNPRTQNQ